MAIDERGVNLRVTADATEARKGFSDVKDAARDMAQSVSRSGEQSGKGIDSIGKDADKAAKNVNRSTGSMVGSIQRLTAELTAGEKGTRKYFEVMGDFKGIPREALEPSLKALDEVRSKQGLATAALASGGIQFDKYGMSAKQTAAAMRGVPAQMTDIIVSLQGGQKPLTVLLQQGGQLKDLFGGIVPAARALGAGVMAMVNPFTLAAAAIAGIYTVYRMGASEGEAFTKTLLMTGNAAGVTAAQLQGMAARMDGVIGTQRSASAALNQFANATKIGSGNLEEFATAALRWEEATGTAVADTVKHFEELGKDPLKASLKLNESMNYLTASVYDQITALVEQGKETEAAAVAQKAFADTINDRAPAIVENIGTIERAWAGVKNAVAGAISAFAGIGRATGLAEELAEAEAKLLQLEDGAFRRGAARRVEEHRLQQLKVDGIRNQISQESALGMIQKQVDDERTKALKATQDLNSYLGDNSRLSRSAQMEKDVAKEKTLYAARVADAKGNSDTLQKLETAHQVAIAGIKDKYKEKAAKKGSKSEAQKELERQQKAELKAIEDFEKERAKSTAGLYAEISAIQEKTQKVEDEIAVYGLSRQALQDMEIARLNEQATVLAGFSGTEEQIAIIEREIEARQRLGAAMSTKETLDKQKKAWAEWESDVKQIFNRVGQSLTDAIFDGGKSGKDLLKGLFKGLTFNVLINPIMGALQGAVTNSMGGMLGLSNPGQGGAASSGMGIMSMLSMAKTAYGAFTGGITSTLASSLSTMGSAIGSSAVQSFALGMTGKGATLAAGLAGPTTAGSAAAGAGSMSAAAIPIVGWIAAGMMANQSLYKQGWDANNGSMNTGVGAVFGGATGSIHKALEGLGMSGSMASLLSGSAITSRLFGMKNKEYGDTSIVGSLGAAGFTGNMETPWSQKGGLFRSNKSGVQYGPVSGDMQNSLSGSFALMQAGISAVAESVGVASDSLNFYSEQIKITLTSDAEKNQEIIANALAGIGERMVTSLIPTIADYARESETASQTLQRLSLSLSTANIYLKQVQNTLLDVSLSGADAAAKLGDVFGGLDKMGEVTQAFYMVAYTEGERAAASLEGMSIALQSVGAAMPKSVRELREMALALDLTTDSGRAAYATLLTIAPEFAAVTEAMKRLAQEAGAALLESFASRGVLVQAMAGAEDTALLADQISALQNSAAAATIDFARFTAGLDGFETDSFVAAISLAFKSIGERIKTLIGDIASERIAVRTAAQQIIDPGAMAPDAIRRQIAGINTVLPGNAGVVAAGVRLSAADAAAEQARRHEEAARNTYMPAKAAYDSGVSQAPTLQAQYDNLYSIIQGKEGEIAIPRKYSEGRKYVRDLQATMPALYEQLNQIGTALNQAKAASAQGGNVANLAAAYAQAVSESAQASAAANAAALDAKKSQTAYADSLQAFAIDAGKSVSKLSSLREETMRYYEAQKALADLMKNSAASIRQTAADYRFGQLDPEDQFKQLKSDFNRNYSMALSTDGDVLAGYADKLNSLINPMLAAAQEMFASDAQYNSFVAQVLARTESIAGRLDTLAPADYEQTSLGLLSQIDATLAALDESTRSAEAIITDAINAGRDATVNGLRQIVNALSGQPIAAFATGGFHTGGLRIVGENGPELEATGPSRIFSSSQTRQMLSGGNGNAEMVMELRALREEVSGLRAETRATASHTAKTARQLERMEIDGMLIRTDADTPIQTEVVA